MAGWATGVLWLFTIDLGMATGAGLYEARIVVPQWFSGTGAAIQVHSNVMRQVDVGRQFWGMVTTAPLTLLTLASLFAAWSGSSPAHAWWGWAAVIALVERVATFGFFIPNAIKLQNADTKPLANAAALARRWRGANTPRLLATALAWGASLKAMTLLG